MTRMDRKTASRKPGSSRRVKAKGKLNRLNPPYGMVDSKLYGRGRYLHEQSEESGRDQDSSSSGD